MSPTELAEMLDRYHESVEAFINGDPEPQKHLWSRADDAVLANPLVPYARGWDAISRVRDQASALLHDGNIASVENITSSATEELAYTLDISGPRCGSATQPHRRRHRCA